MSMINDALKRAKEKQPKIDPPVVAPAMQPVEAARMDGKSNFFMPLLIVVILLLAGALLGLWWHSGLGVVMVRANSRPESAQPASIVAKLPGITPKIDVNPNTAVMINSSSTPASLNAAAVMEPAKPAPITYKLQGIFYNPGKPSAVINGQMVYPGGHIGNVMVSAISADSATIMSEDGHMKVLELP